MPKLVQRLTLIAMAAGGVSWLSMSTTMRFPSSTRRLFSTASTSRSVGSTWAVRSARLVSHRRPLCTTKASIEVEIISCLSDNYAYLLHNPKSGLTAVVDPSEAAPVAQVLKARGLGLDYILNTHHHYDHVGGNEELKNQFDATIIGPKADEDRIPGIKVALADEQIWDMDGEEVHTIHTPGHTKGHCAFYLPEHGMVFTGDTLFSLGCGRLFEGTPAQMHESLRRLAELPESTRVYCGHEYTQSNARFALAVDPTNQDLRQRATEIDELRADGLPTIPTTIGLELKTNPFMRSSDSQLRYSLSIGAHVPDLEVLAELRARKDNF